jgi:hypothetical protein
MSVSLLYNAHFANTGRRAAKRSVVRLRRLRLTYCVVRRSLHVSAGHQSLSSTFVSHESDFFNGLVQLALQSLDHHPESVSVFGCKVRDPQFDWTLSELVEQCCLKSGCLSFVAKRAKEEPLWRIPSTRKGRLSVLESCRVTLTCPCLCRWKLRI